MLYLSVEVFCVLKAAENIYFSSAISSTNNYLFFGLGYFILTTFFFCVVLLWLQVSDKLCAVLFERALVLIAGVAFCTLAGAFFSFEQVQKTVVIKKITIIFFMVLVWAF